MTPILITQKKTGPHKIDPRDQIAIHIGWSRPGEKKPTTWSCPEPDNYNEALFATKPIDCPYVKNQVFYLDSKNQGWWSVYYIKDNLTYDKFCSWLLTQSYSIRWHHTRPIPVRTKQGALHTRLSATELTDAERLYQMGYYEILSSKYSVDATTLSTFLGNTRVLPEILTEV